MEMVLLAEGVENIEGKRTRGNHDAAHADAGERVEHELHELFIN